MDYPILLLRLVATHDLSPKQSIRNDKNCRAKLQSGQWLLRVATTTRLWKQKSRSSLVAHGKTRQGREKPNDNGSNRAAAAGIHRTSPNAKVGLVDEKNEAVTKTRAQSESGDDPKCQTRRRLEGCHNIKENNQGTETEGHYPKLARRFQHGAVVVVIVVDIDVGVVVVAIIGHVARQTNTIRCIAKQVSQIKNSRLDQAARRYRHCGQNQCDDAGRQTQRRTRDATRPVVRDNNKRHP
jgi:hypothetical protein